MLPWPRRARSDAPRPSNHNPPRLTLESLEARDVPSAMADSAVAIPYYTGVSDSTVQAFSAVTAAPLSPEVVAFVGFRGPVVAAVGDVNGDGVSDLIAGAQAPNGHVKVFDGVSGAEIRSFYSFFGFNGAVNVGAADVDGDGFDDVLVSASATHGHVKAFSGFDGAELASFFAFPGFLGRLTVSGADFDGDGRAELLVGAGGPEVGGRVAIFRADGTTFNVGVFAFPGFDNAISVAADDVSGDGTPDVVVGAGLGLPGGHVKAFSGTDLSLVVASFIPFDSTMTCGVDVQVADANLDGRTDILSTSRHPGRQSLSAYDSVTGQVQLLIAGDPCPPPPPEQTVVVVQPIYYDPFFDPYYYGFYFGGYYDWGYDYYDPGYGYYDWGYSDWGYYDWGYMDFGGGGDFDYYDYGGGGDF